MINHPTGSSAMQGIFIYAQLGGFTCSICAPINTTKVEVEAFANEHMHGYPAWQAVNKAKVGIGGSATPNPCNEDAEHRQHWFLMRLPTEGVIPLWP